MTKSLVGPVIGPATDVLVLMDVLKLAAERSPKADIGVKGRIGKPARKGRAERDGLTQTQWGIAG